MDYITIESVELMKTGTWDASTGAVTITDDDLQSILAAWSSDKLPLPVIKIGHVDDRFDNPEWDGEPAYGQIDNLSITGPDDDGVSTLVGDYVNFPSELAEKLASAYPQRSVEIDWDVELIDEQGNTVESYPVALTALALLGSTPPAVKGLASVHVEFKVNQTNLAATRRAHSMLSAAPAPKAKPETGAKLSYPAGHTTDSLRMALSEAIRAKHSEDIYAWVEDHDDEFVWFTSETFGEQGYTVHTYQQSYTVNEDGTINLTGDPVPVQARRTYQPVDPENLSAADVPQQGRATVQANGVDATQTSAAASTSTDKGDDMAFTPAQLNVLRRTLGLADDATGEDVQQELDNQAEQEEAQEQEAGGDPAGDPPQAPEPAEDTQEQECQPIAAAAGDDVVRISRSEFSQVQLQLKQQGEELAAMRRKEAIERKNQTLRSALAAGKITRQGLEKWRKALDDNEDVTTELLSGLPAVVSVSEIGYDNGSNFAEPDKKISEDKQLLDDQVFGSRKGN